MSAVPKPRIEKAEAFWNAPIGSSMTFGAWLVRSRRSTTNARARVSPSMVVVATGVVWAEDSIFCAWVTTVSSLVRTPRGPGSSAAGDGSCASAAPPDSAIADTVASASGHFGA